MKEIKKHQGLDCPQLNLSAADSKSNFKDIVACSGSFSKNCFTHLGKKILCERSFQFH